MAGATSVGAAAPAADAESTRRAASFRPDIEGLRAIAIVPVLLFHAAEFLAPTDGALAGAARWVLTLFPGGYLGVDVFFVISGFLITGLLVREAEKDGGVHFGRFYARRARRILPAATATLLVTLLVSMIVLDAARAITTAGDVLWAGLFNADVRFATSGIDYMGVAEAPSPVLHFWSLNDEEKFYVVWPVVLLLATLAARRLGRLPLRPTLFVALLGIAIPSLWWSQHLVSIGDPSGYFSAFSRAFELAIGGLLAIAMPWVLRLARSARVALSLVGFAVVAWCLLTFSTLTPFPGLNALPVVLGTCAIIAGHEASLVNRGLATPVPRWFGRVSYSLYLWHWPVFVLAAAMTATGQLGMRATLICVGLSILLAWLSYLVIEQPPQRSDVLRRTRNALVFGLVLILTTVVASIGAGRYAEAQQVQESAAATVGITPVVKADTSLLYIGDSITTRGQAPLEAALSAAEWDFRVDGLGGRPLISGKRATWTPLCIDKPLCGADLALAAATPTPGTVVISVGTNAFNIKQVRVAPPTATSSGLRNVTDAQGHWVVAGQDSPADFAAGVEKIMSMVPASTNVYFVGIWLDDKNWANVPWRDNNAAIKAAVAKHPNAHYLDYAGAVASLKIPYQKDGSHPTPDGMALRARWIVSQLES